MDNLPSTEVLGAGADITTEDIEITHLHLTQGVSSVVKDGTAKPGVFCDIETGQTWESLEVIVLGMAKFWNVEERRDGDKRFSFKERLSIDQHVGREYKNDYVEDDAGNTTAYIYTIDLLVLVANDGNAESDFPYFLRLKKAGALNAKRSLMRVLGSLKRSNIESYTKAFSVASKLHEDNNGNEYFVPVFKLLRDSTDAEIAAAKFWAHEFREAKLKQAEYDAAEPAQAEASVDDIEP